MSCFEMQLEDMERYQSDPDMVEMDLKTTEDIPNDFVGHQSQDSQGQVWVVSKADQKRGKFSVVRLDRFHRLKVPVMIRERHRH